MLVYYTAYAPCFGIFGHYFEHFWRSRYPTRPKLLAGSLIHHSTKNDKAFGRSFLRSVDTRRYPGDPLSFHCRLWVSSEATGACLGGFGVLGCLLCRGLHPPHDSRSLKAQLMDCFRLCRGCSGFLSVYIGCVAQRVQVPNI